MLLYVKDNLIARVTNPLDAANYICKHGADNELGNFINDTLDVNQNFKAWRSAMPSITPKALSSYQKEFPSYNPSKVDSEINQIGKCLSEGQALFHGGIWPGGNSTHYKTTRPFSTSFCPQVALRNAEHNGKAYDSNRIDLLALRATNPQTNIFSFRRAGTNLGHENEVLFASGAQLTLRKVTLIRNDYLVGNKQMVTKPVGIYVLEVDIT